jgi:hypothetical protein
LTGIALLLEAARGLSDAAGTRGFSAEPSRALLAWALPAPKPIICNIETIMSIPAPEDQNLKV